MRASFLVVCGLAPCCMVLAAQPIDLEGAIDLALRQNASLRIAALSCDSRRVALESARTVFSVKVSPDAEWRRSEDAELRQVGVSASRKTTWGTSVEVGGRAQQRIYSDSNDYHRDSVRVQLSQPLLQQFGSLLHREPVTAAEQRVLAAERELELRKADVIVRVVETYEQLFLLQQQEAFDQLRLRRLERLRRLTKAKEKQGRAGRVDVLRVQLQYGEAESRMNKTREQLTATRAELAELLGLAVETELEAVRSRVPDLDIPGDADAMRMASARRLDYAQVLADCADAARGVRIARRNLLPDLRLIGEYERFGEGNQAERARDLERDTWFVGLSLGSTDLLRRNERATLRQAELNERTARETAAATRRALERQVRQALAAYQRAKAEWPLAERNCMLAETRLRVAQRMFEMGRGDSFGVTDAEEALMQAQNRLLLAQSEAVVSAYRLLRTLGMLLETPDYLKPALVPDVEALSSHTEGKP